MVRWISDTAYADPEADLSDEVRIGRHCVVGREVRIDRGSVVGDRVWLGAATRIGSGSIVGDHCVIGERTYRPFRFGSLPSIRVGRHVILGMGVVVSGDHRFGSTRIGSYSRIESLVRVSAGARLGEGVTIGAGSEIGEGVRLDAYVQLGSGCRVRPGLRVGRNSIVGSLSDIFRDVPPHVLAEGHGPILRGVNVAGLARGGVDPRSIQSLREAFRAIVRNQENPDVYAERSKSGGQWTAEVREFVSYFTASFHGREGGLRQPGRVA